MSELTVVYVDSIEIPFLVSREYFLGYSTSSIPVNLSEVKAKLKHISVNDLRFHVHNNVN